MATRAPVNIGRLITCTPGVVGGEPCLARTRIPVKKIAVLHNEGMVPEEILAHWPELDLARIHAALAYYYANKQMIDDALESDRRLYEELAARYPRRDPPRP